MPRANTIEVSIDFAKPESIGPIVAKLRENNPTSGLGFLIEGCLLLTQSKFSHAKKKIFNFLISEEVNAANLNLLFSILPTITDIDKLKSMLDSLRYPLNKVLLRDDILKYIPTLLDSLKFSKTSPKEYQSTIGRDLVAHLINKAYEKNKLELALYLEERYYTQYITRIETDKAFGQGMDAIKTAASQAGRRLATGLNIPVQDKPSSEKQLIGFFIHSASMLAHISNLLEFLTACGTGEDRAFIPIIFCFSGRNEKFHAEFSSINVNIIYLDKDQSGNELNGCVNRLVYLKGLCSHLKVTRLVWLCLAVWMPFAFGLKLADKQIWWSQKWQRLTLPEIDQYIFSFGLVSKEKFNGVTWCNGWFQRTKWVAAPQPFKAREIREKFTGKIILGTLAREDKLTDRRYLSAISSILQLYPDAIFLWTGKVRLAEIETFFKSKNVFDQTYFVGWVDTNIYSDVFDILLDSFPIGNGTTSVQVMEMGRPVVIHKSDHEFRTMDLILGAMRSNAVDNESVIKGMRKIFGISDDNHNGLYTCAQNAEEYIYMAGQLIDNLAFRRKVGNAFQLFVNEYMRDPSVSGKVFTSHLLE